MSIDVVFKLITWVNEYKAKRVRHEVVVIFDNLIRISFARQFK